MIYQTKTTMKILSINRRGCLTAWMESMSDAEALALLFPKKMKAKAIATRDGRFMVTLAVNAKAGVNSAGEAKKQMFEEIVARF